MKLVYNTAFIILTAWLMAGCSPVDLVNATVDGDGFSLLEGTSYGPHERQRLDVYSPNDAVDTPVVVFFYGGSWQRGDRGDYRFAGEALTDRGFVTVVPDYRLYPEVRYPEFIEDGAMVLQWVRRHAADFGGDPESIYVAGHSAGAYIAAMLNLDDRFFDSSLLSGMIGLAGPYDFLPLTSRSLREIFSTAEDITETQPINHVSGDEPPMLLVVGGEDRVVEPGNATRLARRVGAAGGNAEVVRFENVGHVMLVGSLAKPLRGQAPTLDAIVDFVARIESGEGVAARVPRDRTNRG